MYLKEISGYALVGFERTTLYRTYKVILKVIREKDTKLVEIKGPDYESAIEILNIVVQILDRINQERENKLYLDEIVYIEPSYVESLVDIEGQSPVPPMWHVYLIDKENKKFLVLMNRIPESIEEGIKLFEYMHDLNY